MVRLDRETARFDHNRLFELARRCGVVAELPGGRDVFDAEFRGKGDICV